MPNPDSKEKIFRELINNPYNMDYPKLPEDSLKKILEDFTPYELKALMHFIWCGDTSNIRYMLTDYTNDFSLCQAYEDIMNDDFLAG